MIWFGWVLWHINHRRLFNARSSLYIYIKYILFDLVAFYEISNIISYLMANPLYIYILNMWHDDGHSFSGCGYGWAPVKGFLCLFWHETHIKGFPTKPEEDEEKQGPRAVNREKLASVKERWRSERGRYWSEELGFVDPEAGSANTRGWVSVPGSCVGNFVRVDAGDSHRMPKKGQTFSLRPNLSLCLFVLLFSTLSYICDICCIFVKHMKCPWPEMRGTTRWLNGHERL